MKYLALLLAAFLTITACETTSPDGSAQQLTMSELLSSTGYAWFPAEMNSFTPDPTMVDLVNQRYDATEHKIYIFVKPSCSCRGTQKLFPQIIKTLDASDIDMDKVEIWSMRSTGDSHPYGSKFQITELPMVFVTRDDALLHEIVVGNYNEVNADTLIANALIP